MFKFTKGCDGVSALIKVEAPTGVTAGYTVATCSNCNKKDSTILGGYRGNVGHVFKLQCNWCGHKFAYDWKNTDVK